MRKFNLCAIFVMVLLTVGTFSCTKDEKDSNVDKTENRLLSDEQIAMIGEQHNSSLKKILDGIDIKSANKRKDISLLQRKVFSEDSNNSELELPQPKSLEENTNILKSKLENKDNYEYFEKVSEFLTSEKNVEEIKDYLSQLKSEMKEKSSSVRDYESFLVYCSVLENSAKFWLPSSLQGENNYYAYKRDNGLTMKGQRKEEEGEEGDEGWKDCLKDILVADGMSASAGFITTAAIAGASGGTLAAPALVGIAVRSGAASAWAYYASDNC